MPVVINPIYTRNFPELGRALLGTDIIVIAVTGDDVTYRGTVDDLLDYLKPAPISITLDGSGESTAQTAVRDFAVVTIYDSSGNTAPYYWNNTTKKVTNGVPGEAITLAWV